MDQHVAYGKWLVEYIKSSIQKASMRDLRMEDSKPQIQKTKSAAAQPLSAEAFNKARKEKKKDWRNRGQEHS